MIRSRLALILIVVILGLIGLALSILYVNPALHYRLGGSQNALDQSLSRQVRPGDTFERVQELLGRPDTGAAVQATGEKLVRESLSRGLDIPDGLESGDRFALWRAGQFSTYLQFRDGRLVNFNPADYAEPWTVSVISR